MIKYYLFVFALLYFLWVALFNLWIPEKNRRQAAEKMISSLTQKIEKYNLAEQRYQKNIEQYKKEAKRDENYQNWAKTLVPADMLRLLQGKN